MTQGEVTSLRNEIRELTKSFHDYVEKDEAWKVRAEPVVKAFENTSWLWKLFIGLIKTIGLLIPIGGVLFTIRKYL